MIKSFRNAAAQAAWARRFIKGVPNEIVKVANRKLMQLHNARTLEDLRAPPGNRLEALSGDRKGQHSIRINDQWRVCFIWRDGDAHDVEIVDYH
jgi:proteic killer suppression protein